MSGAGITTVLRDHLRRGKTFRPPRPKSYSAGKKRITKKKGLKIGSWVDHLFTRVVNGKVKLNPSDVRHRRCIDLFTGLRRRNIKCIRSQFSVGVPELGIKTSLDALGVQGDSAVVIELKCTQYTLEQHKSMYDNHCLHKRMLTNGVLNTERNAHALQTGFGMMALRRVIKPSIKIKGLVVVCAADGAKMYDVDEAFADPKFFSVPSVKPVLGSYIKNVTFQGMPEKPTTIAYLRKLMEKHGYPFTLRNVLTSFGNKYGSFTISTSAKSYLVVALVYTGSRKTKAGDKKHRQLVDDAAKLWIDKKKAVKVRACMLHFSNGREPVHCVEFMPKIHLPK